MKRTLLALLALMSIGATDPPAFDLGELSGDWIMEENGRWTRERWERPQGGTIRGSSETGKGDGATFSETLRISPDTDGTLTLWARPKGAAGETAFRLVRNDRQQLMFENLRHDHPQRIIYHRYGGWLFAQIMMADGSRAKRYVYRPATPPVARPDQPLPDARQVEGAVSFARRCIDTDGYTNCLPPERTHVRNLVCWPAVDVAGYVEPYRSSPAADCSFESHTRRWGIGLDQNGDRRWRADFARLHFLETADCPDKRCKRDWFVPRD